MSRMLPGRRIGTGFIVTLAVLSPAFLSCAENPETSRYRIERDMLRAGRLEQRLQIRTDVPPTPEQAREILKAYQQLLARNPLPKGGSPSDTLIVHEIGRIRAGAEMRIVDLQRFLGDTTAVRLRLEDGVKGYAWDISLSLAFRRALIDEAIARGEGPKAVRLYQEMAADMPARTAQGTPIVEVLQAPIRAADLLNQMGQQDDALAELDRAEVYYRDIIGDAPNDMTAAWSWLQIAEAARRRNNLDKAVDALRQAGKAAASDSLLEPRILLGLGTLQQEGKADLPAAIAVYEELRRSFPRQKAIAAEATWREAACLGGMKRVDEALAAIDTLEERYPRDRANLARGRLVSARILAGAGRWPEAQTRYQSLQANFPESPEALGAPFEIAAHYAALGETEAVRTTLQRAIDGYGKLMEDTSVPEETRRNAADICVRALARLDRWPDAAAQIVANVKRFPRDPRNPVQLVQAAAIYKDRLGDPGRAAEILDQVVAAYPASPLAEKARVEAEKLRGR